MQLPLHTALYNSANCRLQNSNVLWIVPTFATTVCSSLCEAVLTCRLVVQYCTVLGAIWTGDVKLQSTLVAREKPGWWPWPRPWFSLHPYGRIVPQSDVFLVRWGLLPLPPGSLQTLPIIPWHCHLTYKLCIRLLYLCGPSNNFIIQATLKILTMMMMMMMMMLIYADTYRRVEQAWNWFAPAFNQCSWQRSERVSLTSHLTHNKSFERRALPSLLWHCWLGHMTHKNPSLIWRIMCSLGR